MDKRLESLIKKAIDDSVRYEKIKEILVTEKFKKIIDEDAILKGKEKSPNYIMGIPIIVNESIKDNKGYKLNFKGGNE